jgi:hypothetical protein
VQHRKPSQNPSSTHSKEEIDEAQLNLEGCLRAAEQRGEEGLHAELDRIYPGTVGLRSEEMTTPLGIAVHGTFLPPGARIAEGP